MISWFSNKYKIYSIKEFVCNWIISISLLLFVLFFIAIMVIFNYTKLIKVESIQILSLFEVLFIVLLMVSGTWKFNERKLRKAKTKTNSKKIF